MSSPSPERRVQLLTRDLLFRAKLEALVRRVGWEPVRGPATCVAVELQDDRDLERVRELVRAGARVLAFGAHVEAERLRAARQAGAVAVPNSKLEEALRQWLATP